jgi:SNF2 family DNA or RNA helicase
MEDPEVKVMLVSLKAGNAGLNLWRASQVIMLDPFWNPFVEDQAVDRAHRMPQKREVTVRRVLVPETVEDRICLLQDKKREVIGQALDEAASKSLTRLDVRQLKYLFGLG